VAALILYVTLPPKVVFGYVWVMPVLVLVILIPLMVIAPRRHQEAAWQRAASIVQIALLGGFNIATIVLLFVWQLSAHHHKHISGEDMLLAAGQIWLTNVLVYALWFWEIDGNGPDVRSHMPLDQQTRRSDFLFTQMTLPRDVQERLNWKPQFVDYLFLSFTNATAFSPADTYPLTRRAKMLMMAEALKSLVTIALIAGRAINILGS
jgi:hypothetical protein